MNRFVISEIEKYDNARRLVGGKAFSLFKLCRLQISVPQFFVVSVDAFEKFLSLNGIKDVVERLAGKQEYGKISECIMNHEIPGCIWKEIEREFRKRGMEKVSVRSSALVEDGRKKSFAGQFDSFLSIKVSELEKTIRRCWSSYYNLNAVEYMGLDFEPQPQMAVIVQEMIDADISGIGFSRAPIAGYEKYVLVEAAYGVGESIVSGIITPNQYFYLPSNHEIRNCASQQILSNDDVVNLGIQICAIRDAYSIEIDAEWCIKNKKIYFLQARPITAIEKREKPYNKVLTRPLPFLRMQLLAKGEYKGILWLTDQQYYFNPLFLCKNGEVSVYYNNISQKENPINIYRYLCGEIEEVRKKYKEAIRCCSRLRAVMSGKVEFVYKEFISDLIKIYPFNSLGNLAGNFPKFLVGNVYDVFEEFRMEYEEILTEAEFFLIRIACNRFNKDKINLYSLPELFENKKVDEKELNRRSEGYLFFNEQIIIDEENAINNYLIENNIVLSKEEDTGSIELVGASAYGGVASGKVTKISGEQDFYKMEDGNILVASMTVPKYLPVMKKAAAVITDEGGVLCHAAIIAREFQIPTIIGTKYATKVLKDGDRVTVDADSGKVKVENKK